MPAPQKFSMKISLRRNKDSSNPPSSSTYDLDSVSATSNSRRGKAQKVLGGDEPPPRLNGKSSLVSITVSELGQRTPSMRSIERPPLKPRPSSPLLGDRFAHSSANSAADRSLHRYGSSSTLRSYYDPQNSPPQIAQQTSESSVRDYAMRRGHHPRGVPYAPSMLSTTTLGYTDNESSLSTAKRRTGPVDFSFLHRSKPTNVPKPSPQGPAKPTSPISTASSSNWPTSPRSDQGNRLTKSPRAKDVQQTQRRGMPNTRPDPLLAKVNVRKPKPGIQNWFDGCLEDLSEEEEEEVAKEQRNETPRPPSSVKKPTNPRLPTSREGRKAMNSRTSSRASAAGTIPVVLDVRSQKQPLNMGLRPPERRDFAHGGRPQPLKDIGTQNRPPSNRSKNSQGNLWETANLQQDSVLNFSSSSDDSDSQGEEEPVPRTPLFRDSLIATSWRDSDVSIGTARIVKAAFNPGDDLSHSSLIPPAHKTSRLSDSSTTSAKGNDRSSVIPLDNDKSSAVSSINGRSSATQASRLSRLSDMSTSTARYAPQVPPRTASRMLHSQNSFRSNQNLRQSIDPRASIQSISTLGEDQQPSRTASQLSTLSYRPGLDRQPSTKIMRVTRQEESLLAAMRLKKANMKRTILTEAYHTALEEEEAAALAFDSAYERPKTSGDRDSMGESVLQLDNIVSPTIHPRPRTAEGRQSLGPEDFMLLNTPLAPPVQAVPPPPSLTTTTTLSSSHRRSKSQSQSQSDITSTSYRDSIIPSEKADTIASPSTTQTSPITPTATLSQIPPHPEHSMSFSPSSPDLKFFKNLPHPIAFQQPGTVRKLPLSTDPLSKSTIHQQPPQPTSKSSSTPLSVPAPPPSSPPPNHPPSNQVPPVPKSQPSHSLPEPPQQSQSKPSPSPAPSSQQPPPSHHQNSTTTSNNNNNTSSKPRKATTTTSPPKILPGIERSLFAEIDDAAEEAVNLDDFPIWAKGWNGNMQATSPISPSAPPAA